jgi:hypothetical protein
MDVLGALSFRLFLGGMVVMTCEQFEQLVALFLSVYKLVQQLIDAIVKLLEPSPA